MSDTDLFELVIAGIALLVLGLAAWVEVWASASNRVTIRELVDERLMKNLAAELAGSQQLRSSMLLLQVLSAGVAMTLVTLVFVSLEVDGGVVLGILLSSAAVVLVGRLIPRAIAAASPPDPRLAQGVGRGLRILFWPLIWPVERLSRPASRIGVSLDDQVMDDGRPTDGSTPALNGTVDEPDDIEPDEQEMIVGVLNLEEVHAQDIMVPRVDIIAIPRTATVAEAVDVAIQAGHSRIPVYGENIDEVLGIVYAKDLLRYVSEPHEQVPITSVLRPTYFVPEFKRVDDLLSELQQTKVHIAVVVDEYGGTAGVVTIEDILEEIVGEIEDEYDKADPRIEQIGPNELVVDGRVLVENVYDYLNLVEGEASQAGTVGGVIQRELGRIPRVDETVEVAGLRLTVVAVERRRVRQVRVELLSETGQIEVSSVSSPAPSS
jgi:CBS domain containing-hemolysin-like protein